jgi:hypothetical protein
MTYYYAESISPELYKYIRPFVVTEPGLCYRENALVHLSLTASNFNFQLLESNGKDIRFAESYTGSNALRYWVSRFDLSVQNLNVWIDVPNLELNESRVLYMFFGRENDIGSSDIDSVSFYFAVDFRGGFIDTNKVSYSGNIYFEKYGLRMYYTTYLITKNAILDGKTKWVVDVDTFWKQSDYGNNSYSDFRIVVHGDENPFTTYYYPDGRINTNAQITSTYVNYYKDALEINNYNRMLVGYREEVDYMYFELRNRNNRDDMLLSFERRGEGDTRPTKVSVSGYNYRGFEYVYVGNIVIREFYEKEFELDISQLYVSVEYVKQPLLDLNKYGPNVVDISYAHFSDPNGDPYKLSDQRVGQMDSYFEAESDEVSAIIDFGRNHLDLVGQSIGLYPYKYNPDSGLVCLEVNEFSDIYDARGLRYWEAFDEAGWIALEFPVPGVDVNVFSFKGEGLDHMPQDFMFQGGFTSPLHADEEDWTTLVSGTCSPSDDWHTFYFDNYNNFTFYRFVVKSTFGGKVHRVRRWRMFRREQSFKAHTISKLRLLPSVYHDNEKYFPREIDIYGSNDFNEWTTLLSNHPTNAPYFEYYNTKWQDIKFENIKAFWAYKVVMRNNWAGTNDKIIVDEWEMYESVYELNTKRVLGGDTHNINSIWADPVSNIDKGWIYIVNDGLNYVFDGRFAAYRPFTKSVEDLQKLKKV